MQIALDTSFLMTAIEFKIDVFTELSGWRLFVPAAVKAELQKLATGRGGAATAARLALPIANKAAPLPGVGKADEVLLGLSKVGYIIASQDAVLRKRVKRSGGRVAYLRQRRLIVIE